MPARLLWTHLRLLALLVLATSPKIAHGELVQVAPSPATWRECGDRAISQGRHDAAALLHPPIRHEKRHAGDVAGIAAAEMSAGVALFQSGLAPSPFHIATMCAGVAANAAAACPGTHQPTLVFTTAGGFGDRLRGMVTAYYAALLTHAAFRISWMEPAPIAPYFDVEPSFLWEDQAGRAFQVAGSAAYDPGTAHLVIPGAATVDVIDVYSFFTDPASDFVVGLAPPANGSVTILRTNAPSWLDVVRHPSVRRAADLYGLTDLSRRDLFLLALQTVLRRPAPGVVEAAAAGLPQSLQGAVSQSLATGFGKVDATRRPPGASRTTAAPYRRDTLFARTRRGLRPTNSSEHSPTPALVGVQIRTGGIGEAWTDFVHRHPVESARCFADRARELCQDVYAHSCVVFLTADSRAAADEFTKALNRTGINIIQTRGPILHTDRGVPAYSHDNVTVGEHVDPWMKTYADWAVLSQVDVLLMSHSGYGLTAAWAGGVPHVWQLREGGACEWVRHDACGELPM